jgi:hypothetical protein
MMEAPEFQRPKLGLERKIGVGSIPMIDSRRRKSARLSRTGPNHKRDRDLLMSGFESFGTLLME